MHGGGHTRSSAARIAGIVVLGIPGVLGALLGGVLCLAAFGGLLVGDVAAAFATMVVGSVFVAVGGAAVWFAFRIGRNRPGHGPTGPQAPPRHWPTAPNSAAALGGGLPPAPRPPLDPHAGPRPRHGLPHIPAPAAPSRAETGTDRPRPSAPPATPPATAKPPRPAAVQHSRPPSTPRPKPAPEQAAPRPRTDQVPKVGRWIPAGETVHVQGYDIPGGMLYVGRELWADNGSTEPALINPQLRVNRNSPDRTGRTMDYWPSYDSITPSARAAYLSWLAGGRRDPRASIGYVFLFFYGLERRVLCDIGAQKHLRGELPGIRAEVLRLLSIYGENSSFHGYATDFLTVLDILTEDEEAERTPPPYGGERWPTPFRLRLALGRMAQEGRRVPADWALSWAWYHPQIHPRTPQQRCPDEFQSLFRLRFAERHPRGLAVRPGKTRLHWHYRPASGGFLGTTVDVTGLDVPDVVEQAAPTRKLAELVDQVTAELEPYSRWLGRHPESAGTLAAAALLPAELVDTSDGEVGAFLDWVRGRLTGDAPAVVNAAELIARWPTAAPNKMTKREATALTGFLARHGIGVEPDVRWGGPALKPGPAVLFPTGEAASDAPSPAYTATAVLVHLAAAVAIADGEFHADEQRHLVRHLQTALHLTEAEQTRLNAHLTWAVESRAKLAGIRQRLEALTRAQRTSIGDFLVTVATADGVTSPREVKTLSRIYELLGLDPDRVHQRLRPTHTLGRPPGSTATTGRKPTAGIGLDQAAVAAKLRESEEVAALLSAVFTDEDTPPDTPARQAPAAPAAPQQNGRPPAPQSAPPTVAGLDAAHSALLRSLAERSTWPRSDFHALAARHGLMPDGAVDTLNELALDVTGNPVIDGDDPMDIDTDVLQELLDE